MKKHENGSRSSEDDDNSESDSSSSSSSDSGSSRSSGSSSESNPSPKKKPSSQSTTNVPEWDQNPDLYGIRRSGRSRKEPGRLNDSEGSDEDTIQYSKPLKKNQNSVWNENSSYTESDDNGSYVPKSRPIFKKTQKKSQKGRPSKKTSSTARHSKRRKGGVSSESEDLHDEDDYRRFSRRRKPDSEKPVSYVIPDSDEDIDGDDDQVASWTYDDDTTNAEGTNENIPTIEKILDHRKGFVGGTGAGTTTYNVKAKGEPPVTEESEMQYLINWKGLSHLHNTWESEESLTELGAKGIKKLNNFMSRLSEYETWKRLANPEDIEYNECQMEMSQQLISSHTIPERIIAERTENSQVEYYVKWKNLPYIEATWESGSLIDGESESVIENFRFRQESRYAPSSKSKFFKYRPKFSSIKSQPEYMGGSDDSLRLRDYQLDGINWLVHAWCKQNSVILADEMGLGKTIQTVNFLYYLFHTHQLYGPFLVVVPLSTLDAWQKEFARWAPDINVLSYVGDAASRSIIREYEWTHPGNKRSKFNAILTTYEIVLKDKQFLINVPYAVIMVDEAHRLKNDDSMLYKCLQDLTVYHRLLITGTPLQNSLKELWSLLHFIMPDKFDSWDEFNVQFGTSSAEKRGYTKLHKLLEPCILRRVKKDVEKSLPAKVERILRVDMSRKQKQYYKWILTRNYAALTKGVKGSTVSFVNIVMELKKCCNHILLTRPEEMDNTFSMSREEKLQFLLRGSGKLLLLDKLLVRLKETGHRVLIFSQMVRVLDILAEYLELRRFSFQRLDGGIKGELRRQALEHFNVPGSTDFCFLLSTRAGGLGINLATADTVIIFDSDWNPQNDLQAQARAHRIGQKDQVNVYRLVTMNSVEEDIIERAKKKMILDHLVIQRMDTTGTTILNKPKSAEKNSTPFSKEELSAILKFGAEDLFKDEDEGGEEEPKCDIDEILNRAETREEETGISSTGEEILSAFKVASFAVDEDEPITIEKASASKEWTDIIPQDLRDRVEEEERQKEIEGLCLGPRNRKTLGEDSNKRKRTSDDEDDSDDSGRPSKKRGRPSGKEKITGFTDTEIRRFIKSYKKFPKPNSRLEDIATDAELQEKAMNDLMKLGKALYERCQEAVNEALAADGDASKSKAVSIKIGNVVVNAKTLVESVHLLEPLATFLPSTSSAPDDEPGPWSKIKSLPFKYKDPGYDEIEWGVTDDVNLLKGVHIHGYGSWDSIKMDKDLHLRDKIMSNADRKPQAKHLDTRVAFLLRSLKKSLDGGEKGGAASSSASKKTRASRPKKSASVAVLAQNENSNDCKSESHHNTSEGGKYKSVDYIENTDSSNDEDEKIEKTKETKKENIDDRNRDKKSKKKKDKPILHITAKSEPIIIGELAPEIFAKCKEMMRVVKKSLKSLDRPDQSLEESEKAHHNRHCLLQIGKHIDSILSKMNSEEKSRDWKSHLWCFVSKFTEHDAKKLYKLYRHAMKKKHREKSEDSMKRSSVVDNNRKPSSSSNSSSSYRQSSYHHYNNKMNSSSSHPSSFRRDDPGKGKSAYHHGGPGIHGSGSSSEHLSNKYPPPVSSRKSYEGPRGHHHLHNQHNSHHQMGGQYRESGHYGGGHYDNNMYGGATKPPPSHHQQHHWMGGNNGSSASYGNNQPPPHRKHEWRGPPPEYR